MLPGVFLKETNVLREQVERRKPPIIVDIPHQKNGLIF